jgi:3-oxoacyl-[acyl-carrier protein] reductase
MRTDRFTGKNVCITGAASGFGRETARRFAAEGANYVYLVDLSRERLASVEAEVRALGAQAVPIVADVGDIVACDQAIAQVLTTAERLDVLISNAAPPRDPEPFLTMNDDTWLEDVRVILTASYVLGQRAARAMTSTGGGVILYTASISALGAGVGFAAYCAAKAGILALVKVMAAELAPYRIRVNAVSPGPADTQRSVQLVGAETMEKFRRSFPAVPLNRLARVDDIANAFLFLASEEASYVTGHNFIVDGGLTSLIYNVPDA